MTVFVLSTPDANGWMSILCGGEVGYAPATYIYSGGSNIDFDVTKTSNAVVSGTGGGGLNCRSGAGTSFSVIGYFAEGGAVNLTGTVQGDWVQVVCGGSHGWVHGSFLKAAGTPSTGSTGSTGSVGTATVSGTNGAGLRCRSTASTDSSIITVLAEGMRVSVRGAAQGDWLPITCANQNGFAHKGFLTTGSGTGDTGSNSGDTDGKVTGGTVTVSGTGGSRLNCRTGAGSTFPATTSVAEGTVLQTRGAASNGWLPVVCNGSNLWVSISFVTAGGTTTPTTPPPTSGTGTVTGTATVTGTNAVGLRCRSGAGNTFSIITVLAANSTVSLRAGSQGDWQAVVCAGQNGFAAKMYLSTGGGSGTTPTPAPTQPTQPSGFVNGDHAKTTASLNLRYDPQTGNNVASVAPSGTVVQITGGHAGNGYYPVNWDGLKGYMHGDFLTKTTEALSKRGGSATPTDPPPTSGGGGTATGNSIVSFAMGYVGYPYVWATAGPYSFDCSGFTNWVIKNVTGKDIGRGLWTQVPAGTPVSRSALQPGDLVFHQNTYKAGLSHVGIYIGDNKMVNALNQNAGVVVSDITTTYWESRWYGATRIR